MKKTVTFTDLEYIVKGSEGILPLLNPIGTIVMSTRTKTEKVLKQLSDLTVLHSNATTEVRNKLQEVFSTLLSKYGTEEEVANKKLNEDSPNLEDFRKEWTEESTKIYQGTLEIEFSIGKELFDKEKLSAEQLQAINLLFA